MAIEWSKALELETKVAFIIEEQRQNGVLFDIEKAHRYVQGLQDVMDDIHSQVRPYLLKDLIICETNNGKEIVVENQVFQKGEIGFLKSIFLKNGSYSRSVSNWIQEVTSDGLGNHWGLYSTDPYDLVRRLVAGPFTRIRWEEPSLTKREKLSKQLLYFGWKPKEFTPTGQPQLTVKGIPVDTLQDIEGPIGKLIGKYYLSSHRQAQIKGWIEAVRPDGRIEAQADTVGTNTARFRHRVIVNVPKAEEKVYYGHQMRSLFIASPGTYMCGYDASGLSLAHYKQS
jgi:hypothetical protein